MNKLNVYSSYLVPFETVVTLAVPLVVPSYVCGSCQNWDRDKHAIYGHFGNT